MSKYLKVLCSIILFFAVMFPAPAYASSGKVSSHSNTYYLSSITSMFSSLFSGGKHKGNGKGKTEDFYYGSDNKNKGHNDFWDWLSGKDNKNNWENHSGDSFSNWQKYYCY